MVTLSKAKRRVKSTTGDALDRVGPAAGSARESVASALDDAKGRIGPALGDAKDKVGPALGETRDRIGPLLEDARSLVVPVAQQAIAESRRKGRKAAVKLGIAEEPKTTHKFRNLLVLLGVSGAGLFLYKKFFGRTESWSDAGEPPTPAKTTAPAATEVVKEAKVAAEKVATKVAKKAAGARAKIEAKVGVTETNNNETAPTAPLASEETVASHEPTTPDNPLEETQIHD